MSARTDDRAEVAARYASDLRTGVEMLRVRRRRDVAQRLRTATYRAASGVLRYSDDPLEQEFALTTLEDLERTRHAERLERDAAALVEHGATIPPDAIQAAAHDLAVATAAAHAADLRKRADA